MPTDSSGSGGFGRRSPGAAWLTATALCAPLLLATAARAHSHAEIDARFAVDGARVDATLRLSLRDLRHMVPVDRDGDGSMSPAEVQAAREPLGHYLPRTLKLRALPGGQVCDARLDDLQLVDLGSVDALLHFGCPAPATAFELSAGLFGGTGHTYDLHARFVAGAVERHATLTSRQNRVEVSLAADREGVPWLSVAGVVSLVAVAGALLVLLVVRRRGRQGVR